ncbi:MAG TPA: ornithine cyclodeaminase family protein [Candidatus Angelobacter sp.]|nr:ornithine cyclodeaminase family protein [Candidatus Angelobacter sp.]
MLTLSDDQVRRVTEPGRVIEAIRAAFARDYAATLQMPVRTAVSLGDGGVLLIMPAYDSAMGIAGVKTVIVTKAGGVSANYELLDPKTGLPLARMQANYLTDLRTAATSAVATDILARPDARTLGVFGSGRQAEGHFAVVRGVRKFQRYMVCGSGRRSLSPFIAAMRERHGLHVEPVDARTCAAESDVICTCTTSGVPVFEGEWLRPGTHINAVGAFQPGTREVDDYTVRHARVVVETYDAAFAEAGDLLVPISNKAITKSHIAADLHEIAGGSKPGRLAPDEITLFKSLGCALEDLVTANLVYHQALKMKPLKFGLEPES